MFNIDTTRFTGIRANSVQSSHNQTASGAPQSLPTTNLSALHPPADQVTIRFGMPRNGASLSSRDKLLAEIAEHTEKLGKYERHINEYSAILKLSPSGCRNLAQQERNKAVSYEKESEYYEFHRKKAVWYEKMANVSIAQINERIAESRKNLDEYRSRKAAAEKDLDALDSQPSHPPRRGTAPSVSTYNDDFNPKPPRKSYTAPLNSASNVRPDLYGSRKKSPHRGEDLAPPKVSTSGTAPKATLEVPMDPMPQNIDYADSVQGVNNRYQFSFLSALGRPPSPSKPPISKTSIPSQSTDDKPAYNTTRRRTEKDWDPLLEAILKDQGRPLKN
jgi:hypothetical protein